MAVVHPAKISTFTAKEPNRTSNTSAPPPISQGQVIEARVSERIGTSRYLLQSRNLQFNADSELPLQLGEKLTLRVDQVSSPAILRVLSRESMEASPFNDALRFLRTNPEALANLFQKGGAALSQQLDNLFPEKGKALSQSLERLAETLKCSSSTLKNPLFIKDYIDKLGLQLESRLRKTALQGKAGEIQPQGETLKSALLKLQGELEQLLKGSAPIPPDELQSIANLAKFTDNSLKAIETLQMINIYAQENDSKYYLQVPFQFNDSVRMGEIFIDAETGRKRAEGDESKFHIVMFLSMDRLGELMVDATFHKQRIACVFTVYDDESLTSIDTNLVELRQVLSDAGYEVDVSARITSLPRDDNRLEYKREMFSGLDGINVYI